MMNTHPGGVKHSRYLIELSFLAPGSRVLDMGAGDGSTVTLLCKLGYEAVGIDLSPRSADVASGNFLHLPYPEECFDGVISQCSFFVSGDVSGALAEAARVLRPGGKLVFSDVTRDVVQLLSQVRQSGFAVRHLEDLTPAWQEFYLEALWTSQDCTLPTGKAVQYVLFVCERK